jgi:hypothetical protein
VGTGVRVYVGVGDDVAVGVMLKVGVTETTLGVEEDVGLGRGTRNSARAARVGMEVGVGVAFVQAASTMPNNRPNNGAHFGRLPQTLHLQKLIIALSNSLINPRISTISLS